jgi:hypothetical protein
MAGTEGGTVVRTPYATRRFQATAMIGALHRSSLRPPITARQAECFTGATRLPAPSGWVHAWAHHGPAESSNAVPKLVPKGRHLMYYMRCPIAVFLNDFGWCEERDLNPHESYPAGT